MYATPLPAWKLTQFDLSPLLSAEVLFHTSSLLLLFLMAIWRDPLWPQFQQRLCLPVHLNLCLSISHPLASLFLFLLVLCLYFSCSVNGNSSITWRDAYCPSPLGLTDWCSVISEQVNSMIADITNTRRNRPHCYVRALTKNKRSNSPLTPWIFNALVKHSQSWMFTNLFSTFLRPRQGFET